MYLFAASWSKRTPDWPPKYCDLQVKIHAGRSFEVGQTGLATPVASGPFDNTLAERLCFAKCTFARHRSNENTRSFSKTWPCFRISHDLQVEASSGSGGQCSASQSPLGRRLPPDPSPAAN